MRNRLLMKVISFSFLAMCSGFMTHTVQAKEQPSVVSSTETSTEVTTQDNTVVEESPIDYQEVLKDVTNHYQKCKKEDEEKARQIRLKKLRAKRLRIKRQKLKKQRELEKSCLGTFLITAYCPCYECSEGYGNRIAWTGAGHKYAIPVHTIAVDKNIIPYGTKVKIEGYGDQIFVAEDCGGYINGMHVDMYMSTHSETINFKKHGKIYVVK